MHFKLWQHITVDGQFRHSDCLDKVLQFLLECKTHNQNPVFELAPEGFSIENKIAWKTIELLYLQNGFSHQDVTLSTCDLSAAFDCVTQKHTMFLDWASEYMQNNQFESGNYTPINFMHFIGRLTWDRVFVHNIIKSQYANKSYYRLHGYKNGHGAQGQCFHDLLEQGFSYQETVDIIKHIEHLPQQNTGNFEKLEQNFNFPHNVVPLKEYYGNAFVDIVHETDITENNFFITEKTIRPMIFRRPFIMIGGKHFMKKLQSLGFQTFANWWSEDYDDLHGKDRLRKVQNLLQRLSDLNVDQMRSILKDMDDVLEHNYMWLKEKKYKHE